MNNPVQADMDLQGNIERFKLPEILQLLSMGRKSGTLGIQREGDIVMVYFKDGVVTYGYGPRQTMHLGQLLREREKISAETLTCAVETQEKSENTRRLGEILVEMNAVDRADIIEVVTEQVKELMYSLMSWDSGNFKFYENQYPTEEEITVELSTENIILEGLRRLDEMNHLRDTLPSLDTVFAISQAATNHPMDINLNPEEWNIMALINGRRTIRDVIEISNLSEVDTLKKLAALKLAGLVSETEVENIIATGAEQEDNKLEKKMSQLTTLLEEYLKSDPMTINMGAGVTDLPKSTSRMVGSETLTELMVSERPTMKTENRMIQREESEEKLWNELNN
ncbi:MAG: DUF4388 domain-containing protein [candidate division Zixibacteria bacterium]|nr:DUF4388 domain-containing protein [candidate division Zixibacteria bacterium]